MTSRLIRYSGPAALIVSLMALMLSMSGISLAGSASRSAARHRHARAGKVVRLNSHGKIPSHDLPAGRAGGADTVAGRPETDLVAKCPSDSVDLGTFCIQTGLYSPQPAEVGKTDYFFATQKCVSLGGYLPTAAQLVGAAPQLTLASTIDDNPATAIVAQDPSVGLKDKREMSATLITTAAGSSAAGSEGVTQGSRGDPRQHEPDPTPQPANPAPSTLQYVTVYDNHNRGGFAGGEPVSRPENFRCAFDKVQNMPQPGS